MTSRARVVVIGGGIVGVSVIYHLAKLGWKDLVLVEKNELTAGATWHAAGHTPTASGSLNLSRMQAYSVELYQQLEKEAGHPLGIHIVGSVNLACTPDRIDEYKRSVGRARTIGLQYEIIGPGEAKKLFPFIDTKGVLAALYDPRHGHVDPTSVTNALASSARALGATIKRRSPVKSLERSPQGHWIVRTAEDAIAADVVVNAAGMWAPEIAAMAGTWLPIIPVLHQYLVTEPVPAIQALKKELPILRDRDSSFYLRQEQGGILTGVYERECEPWSIDGIPPEFGQELLPPDLDRMQESLEKVAERVPIFAEAGIKRIVNGPISYTPDERPIIGPVPGLDNFYTAAGFAVGIAQAGGAGKFLAEWIVEGEPAFDPTPFYPARFGDFVTKSYVVAKAIEAYADHHNVDYPNKELTAGRPARTTPIYDLLKQEGCIFGSAFGWERPLWFAPSGEEAVDHWTFRRGRWFGPIGEECRNLRENVGLSDLSTFAKYVIEGPKAETFLNTVFTGKVPLAVGRIGFNVMVNTRGGIVGDFTVTRIGEQSFYVTGPSAGEFYHMDIFGRYRPESGVSIQSVSSRYCVLHIAGPKSRDLLTELARTDVSNKVFPYMHARYLDLGVARLWVMRVSFSGDLGYELHVPVEYQRVLYLKLREAGAKFGLKWIGIRALGSLRLEKGYKYFGSDLTSEVTALQAGFDRFVRFDKSEDFVGRVALLNERQQGSHHRLVTLQVEADDADAIGGEPIFDNGRLVGVATSGGYGYTVAASLAVGWVETGFSEPGTKLEIEVLGDRRPAVVVADPIFDPEHKRIRG